jgi:hypothetical protein
MNQIEKELVSLASVARKADIHPQLAKDLLDAGVFKGDFTFGRYHLFRPSRVPELVALVQTSNQMKGKL